MAVVSSSTSVDGVRLQQTAYGCTLSPEMLEKARLELNEDTNTRHLEIKTLRQRLEKVHGLKCRLDEAFLLRFLRCKKFDQERAFSQVVKFYTMRKENPDVYANLTPRKVRNILEAGVAGVLVDRAPDGSRILYFRPARWDPDRGTLAQVLGNNYLTLSKLIENEEIQVCGITLLADLKDIGWKQARHLSPFFAKKIALLLQEAFPARMRGLHYVNEPFFFDIVFKIIKQFLKEKFQKRIHVHGNIHADSEKMKKFHLHFPPAILPEDLGGRLPPFCAKDWADTVLACEQQFVDDNKFGYVDVKTRNND